MENEILILIVVEKFKMDVRQGSRGKLREDAVGKSTECEIIYGYWDSGNRPTHRPTNLLNEMEIMEVSLLNVHFSTSLSASVYLSIQK